MRRKTTFRIAIGALAFGACGWVQAAIVELVSVTPIEFQPSAGQKAKIQYTLSKQGTVTLDLYSPDGDRVRTLSSKRFSAAGTHDIEWDGRDDKGQIVPDEAYQPVLTCDCGEPALAIADSRATTGGVVIEKIRPQLSSDGTISFELPQPARALVRVGIKGGAMMRAVDTWSPRAAGRTRMTWDGFDQSGVVHLLGYPALTVLVTAFTLPDHSVLTSGNDKTTYAAYRQARGWGVPLVDASSPRLERDGKRLSRQAALPRSLLQDPRVSIRIVEQVQQGPGGAFKVTGPVTFRVDMPADDKWLVQQSLYEVGFFLDHQFVSEEETGYTPISWRWDPAGIAPGEHIMTVNISGFWGQVGVASVRLLLAEK